MLFAAGFGTRMGALTAHTPKPLITVGGKTLLDHAIALADGAGIEQKVVNTHYLADQISNHLAQKNIAISYEETILDTGGGLKKALPLLFPQSKNKTTHKYKKAIVTLNTDAIWIGENPLIQLISSWNPEKMDVLFTLLPARQANSANERSDFIMDNTGRVSWAKDHPQESKKNGYLYLGAQIINPELLEAETKSRFSLHGPWQRVIAKKRAFGIVYRGRWCDVGHPLGVEQANNMLQPHKDQTDMRR